MDGCGSVRQRTDIYIVAAECIGETGTAIKLGPIGLVRSYKNWYKNKIYTVNPNLLEPG